MCTAWFSKLNDCYFYSAPSTIVYKYYVSGILVGVGKYGTRQTQMPLPCSLHLSVVFLISI